MRDPVEVLAGGELLLSGQAVAWFATMAERAVQMHRANGVRDPRFEAWTQRAAAAATLIRTSLAGSAELPVAPALSSSVLIDPVDAAEAGRLMGTTSRNVRDLCARESLGTARRVSGRWFIERAEVLDRVQRERSA